MLKATESAVSYDQEREVSQRQHPLLLEQALSWLFFVQIRLEIAVFWRTVDRRGQLRSAIPITSDL